MMSKDDKNKISDLGKLINKDNIKKITSPNRTVIVENFLDHMKDQEHKYPAVLNFLVIGVDSNDGDFLASEFEAKVESTEDFIEATKRIVSSIRDNNDDIAQLRVFVSENLKVKK